MKLLNATDWPMSWSVSIKKPIVMNGSDQVDYPPRTFIIQAGEEIDVTEEAAEVLLEHLGPRGLVARQPGESDDELIARSRTAFFRWLGAQVRRHQNANREQKAKGLGLIEPNDDVLRCFRHWKKLKATEFADPILAEAMDAITPAEQIELSGDPGLAAAYENRSAMQRAFQSEGGLDVPPAL